MTTSIADVMRREVVSVGEEASLAQALELLTRHRIGMLPVLDAQGRLVGVLRLRSILKLLLPAFVNMVGNYDFVEDFGALERSALSEERRRAPVTDLMDPPLAVASDSGLLRAHAYMRQHDLYDLPVTDAAGRLIGLASWVDIGLGLLTGGPRRAGA